MHFKKLQASFWSRPLPTRRVPRTLLCFCRFPGFRDLRFRVLGFRVSGIGLTFSLRSGCRLDGFGFRFKLQGLV